MSAAEAEEEVEVDAKEEAGEGACGHDGSH